MTSLAEALANRGIKTGAAQGAAPPAQMFKQKMVLVVDDDDAMRSALIAELQNEYRVLGAASGHEAIRLHSDYQDDLRAVVMDAKMPGMDGFQASEALRELNPDLPIVMLTAYQDMRSVSDIVEHRFSAYVVKGEARIGPTGEVEFGTLPVLKDKLATVIDAYSDLVSERFFAHVKDPKERTELIAFSRLFDAPEEVTRVLEDHSIAGHDEAERYARGTSYDENADYLLFAREVDHLFGIERKKVVELCSGPGGLTRAISSFAPATVVGLDGSEHMITFAQARHNGPNLSYRLLDLFKASTEAPELIGADVVLCQNSMHHFAHDSLYEFFKAGINLLKNGGHLYISDYRRESLDADVLAQRLLATNKHVRQDLVNTIQSSLTKSDIIETLDRFGDQISYKVFYPDERGQVFDVLKRLPEYGTIIANDPHPHHLDYKLSLRVHVTRE